MAEYSQSLPLTSGSTPNPLIIKLDSQHTPVRGILVDNADSTVNVLIYQGTSPNGQPISVPAGYLRAIPISGTSALYLVFSGVASAAGSIYIHASSEPMLASDSQVKSVTVVGPVPVTAADAGGLKVDGSAHTQPISAAATIPVDGSAGSFPVTGSVGITGTPNVAVPGGVAITGTPNVSVTNQPTVAQAAQYPNNAVPFFLGNDIALISGTPVTFASIAGIAGRTLYIAYLYLKGLDEQDTFWGLVATNLNAPALSVLPFGRGNIDQVYNPGVQGGAALASPVNIQLNTNDTLLGTVNVRAIVGGYFL